MTTEQDLRELLHRAQRAMPTLPSASPADRLAAVRRAAADEPGWFDGKPARRLLAYVAPMGAAVRLAPVDAAAELLAALVDEDFASLLVLDAVQCAERLAAYAQRRAHAPGWGLDRDVSDASDGQPLPRLEVKPGAGAAGGIRLNLAPASAGQAACGATGVLVAHWIRCLKAGQLDELDRPPGLPGGAVLGVLEEDAARLWPALFDDTGASGSRPALPEVLKARKLGDEWDNGQEDALLVYVERCKAAERGLQMSALHDEIGKLLHCGASNIKIRLAAARKRRTVSAPGVTLRRTA